MFFEIWIDSKVVLFEICYIFILGSNSLCHSPSQDSVQLPHTNESNASLVLLEGWFLPNLRLITIASKEGTE